MRSASALRTSWRAPPRRAAPRRERLAPSPCALAAAPATPPLATPSLTAPLPSCLPRQRPDILQRLTETLVACVGVLSEAQASHAFSATAAAHFGSLVGLFSTALLPHLAAVADLLVPWRPAAGAADEGGDGGGERMVAAVLAELQPLLLPPEGAAAAPAAATPAAAAPAAAPK